MGEHHTAAVQDQGAPRRVQTWVPAAHEAVLEALAAELGLAQAGDIEWLTSECEPSERHDFTGVLEEGEALLARLRL